MKAGTTQLKAKRKYRPKRYVTGVGTDTSHIEVTKKRDAERVGRSLLNRADLWTMESLDHLLNLHFVHDAALTGDGCMVDEVFRSRDAVDTIIRELCIRGRNNEGNVARPLIRTYLDVPHPTRIDRTGRPITANDIHAIRLAHNENGRKFGADAPEWIAAVTGRSVKDVKGILKRLLATKAKGFDGIGKPRKGQTVKEYKSAVLGEFLAGLDRIRGAIDSLVSKLQRIGK